MKITGLDNVLRNLNQEITKIKGRTKQGLIKASLFVKAESLRQTPIDLGNLRGSAFVDYSWGQGPPSGAKFTGPDAGKLSSSHPGIKAAAKAEAKRLGNMVAVIGYTAYYAPFVHEINKNYLAPGTNWQFLRNAIVTNDQKILSIIASEARIP